MKARSDSLYARLLRLTRPEEEELDRLDELMLFLKSGHSYEDAAGLCHEWGVRTSESAVHDLYVRHSFSWSLERAKAAAVATGSLPSFEREIRKLNEQAIFESVSNPGTDQKIQVAIYAMEIEKQKLELATRSAETRFALEREKLDVSKRRVTLLEKKLARAQDLVSKAKESKGGLTPATLKQIEEALHL